MRMTRQKPVGGYFRVLQDNRGTFTLQQTHDRKLWVTVGDNLTLQQVMDIQSKVTNSNIMNFLNFISILKQQ